MDSEMWKDVAEYEWLYQISNLSRVRRMAGSAKREKHLQFTN